MSFMTDARNEYHRDAIRRGLFAYRDKDGKPRELNGVKIVTCADGSSDTSVQIAFLLSQEVLKSAKAKDLKVSTFSGQEMGRIFGQVTMEYLKKCLDNIKPDKLREFTFGAGRIVRYAQYAHLEEISDLVKRFEELQLDLGEDYIVEADILVGREPAADSDFGSDYIAAKNGIATSTPTRKEGAGTHYPILQASISCKWTMRSDRAQNVRTEALNLIRHRKGRLPAMLFVTAEPEPSRLASLAKGTGDIDRVYHFALYELIKAVDNHGNKNQEAQLDLLVRGKRLSDISDLPFDVIT